VSIEQIVGLCLALLVMGVGILGSLLPAVPSTPLVLAGAVAHRLYFAEASVGNFVLVLLLGITLFSLGIDYLATMLGARKLGATWRGILGAVVGAGVGLFFSLPGIILGPFIGAFLFEMVGGRKFDEAARAGVGALLGLLAGALGKMACGLAMMGVFTGDVIYRSMGESGEMLAAIVFRMTG
jgi:uncharacterized protein